MKKIIALIFTLSLLACQSTPVHIADNSPVPTLNENSVAKRKISSDIDAGILHEGNSIALEKCGGKNGLAEMYRIYNPSTQKDELRIRVSNIECGMYKTMYTDSPQLLLQAYVGDSREQSFAVNEDDPGFHKLVIGSKAYFENPKPGSRADIIYFYVPAKVVEVNMDFVNRSEPYDIPYCGGKVHSVIGKNGMVYVTFSEVTGCDTVDIHTNDKKGRAISKSYSLHPDVNGLFRGMIEVPKASLKVGLNTASFHIYKQYYYDPSVEQFEEANVKVNFIGL